MSNESLIRIAVRSMYDLQKLRVATGNRIVASFRTKLGLESSQAEESDKEAEKLLKELRSEFKRITDGVKRVTRSTKFDSKIITSVAELELLEAYERMCETERVHEKAIEYEVEKYPIYSQWMVNVRGVGPLMAGVILSEVDITKCNTVSALWKYCFLPGTLVSTESGMIPIEQLTKGDTVIDAEGYNTGVKETLTRNYSGDLTTIYIEGSMPLVATAEHPVLVYRDGTRSWVEAKDVAAGDRLILPKVEGVPRDFLPIQDIPAKARKGVLKAPIPLTLEIAYIMGLFVADGCAIVWNENGYDRGSIAVSLHGEDHVPVLDMVRKSFGSGWFTAANQSVNFGRYVLAREFQKWFGHLAHNKKIPDFIMSSSAEITLEFLKGYFFGDGHIVKAGKSKGSISATSASKGLILQLQLLLAKNGIFAPVHLQVRKNTATVINGKNINQLPNRYVLSIPASETPKIFKNIRFNGNRKARKVLEAEDAFLLRVKAVDSSFYEGVVHNLHTESNTYCVQNIAVHNCGLDTVQVEKEIQPTRPGWGIFKGKELVSEYYEADFLAHNELEILKAKGERLGIAEYKRYKVKRVTVPDGEKYTAVVGEGRSRKKSHLVPRTYTNRDGEVKETVGITYNPMLKTKMVGVLGDVFIKLGGKYRDIYDGYKFRLENHPNHKDKSKAHRHRMTVRYMVKMFLQDLWLEWRRLEGLEVRPPYAEEKLGIVHSKP